MTLTLNTVNQFFCMTLWFIMVLHNNIRFGDKMFCVQRILSGQTFTNILNLRCDLDFEHSKSNFPTGHSGLWCCTIKPSLVANKTSSLELIEDKVKIVIVDYISPRCDIDIKDGEPIFLHDTSPCDNTPPYQIWFFFLNGPAVQEMLSGHDQTQAELQTKWFQYTIYNWFVIFFSVFMLYIAWKKRTSSKMCTFCPVL